MTAKGDDIGGQVDLTVQSGEETRAKAVRYLTASGNDDLLPVLGLDDEPIKNAPMPGLPSYEMRDGKLRCRTCTRPTQKDGKCRRRDCGGAR